MAENTDSERERRPPGANRGQSSDQRPGEEVVQVNDAYTGGQEPPDDEPSRADDQHPTGG